MSARILLWVDAPALFVRWLDAAVDAGAIDDQQEHVDALAWISVGANTVGTNDLALRRARESMALAASSDSAPSPWALWTLAQQSNYQGRFDDYLAYTTEALRLVEHHSRFAQLFMRAIWLDAYLRVHGYDGNEALIDDVLRETSEHLTAHTVAVICAASTALYVKRELAQGLRYLDTVTDLFASGPVVGAWLSAMKAMALCDVDPLAGVGYAVQAARWSDRGASSYALHHAVLTLAVLATRIGRLDAAQPLLAHAEAFPGYQANPQFSWLRAETLAGLEIAGLATPILAHELSRQELFTIFSELEATS